MILRPSSAACLLLLLPMNTLAVDTPASPTHAAALARHDQQVAGNLRRASEFIAVAHVSAENACETAAQPEPLTTPDPLFAAGSGTKRVKVSFIIGTDGHVH